MKLSTLTYPIIGSSLLILSIGPINAQVGLSSKKAAAKLGQKSRWSFTQWPTFSFGTGKLGGGLTTKRKLRRAVGRAPLAAQAAASSLSGTGAAAILKRFGAASQTSLSSIGGADSTGGSSMSDTAFTAKALRQEIRKRLAEHAKTTAYGGAYGAVGSQSSLELSAYLPPVGLSAYIPTSAGGTSLPQSTYALALPALALPGISLQPLASHNGYSSPIVIALRPIVPNPANSQQFMLGLPTLTRTQKTPTRPLNPYAPRKKLPLRPSANQPQSPLSKPLPSQLPNQLPTQLPNQSQPPTQTSPVKTQGFPPTQAQQGKTGSQ